MDSPSLLDQFDILVETPGSIAKLRRFVLRCALKGELTERRREDSSVESLIDQMQEEKQRLYDEGEIRKPRNLDSLSREEEWYPIPEEWKWTRIGEVGRVIGGSTPRTSNDEYWAEEGIAWLTPGDLGDHEKKKISRGDRDISRKGLNNCSATLLPPGSVLFSSRAPIGYVAIAASELATNQGFKSVRPYEMSMSDYIYWFLKYAGKRINSEASGTTFTEVSGADLANIPFPLPPNEEQQRIVERIERLMSELDDLEIRQEQAFEKRSAFASASTHALRTAESEHDVRTAWTRIREHFEAVTSSPENVDDLRQAVLQLAVEGRLTTRGSEDTPAGKLLKEIQREKERLYEAGEIRKPKKAPPISEDKQDLPSLPRNWKWARLAELIEEGPRNGYSPQTVKYKTGVKRLDLTATTSGYFQPEYFEYVDEEISEDSPLWLEAGDILIQRGNSIEYVGIAAVYDGPENEYIYPDLMMRLKPSPAISTNYLHSALLSGRTRRYYRDNASGTSGNMPKINQGDVLATPIPVPPVEEQHRIVERTEAILPICDNLGSKLEKQEEVGSELADAVLNQEPVVSSATQ